MTTWWEWGIVDIFATCTDDYSFLHDDRHSQQRRFGMSRIWSLAKRPCQPGPHSAFLVHCHMMSEDSVMSEALLHLPECDMRQ